MGGRSLIGEAIGNYVVREQVGEGGMGVVYRADHRRLSRRVAVKVLHPDSSQRADIVQRFFNEARAASELRHPNLIEVFDFGELSDGQSYIVMEWLDGQSLAQALAAEGRLDVPRALGILIGICEALGCAHAHGIVHRDLKPDNVFLIERGGSADFVKVLDFGIAKLGAPGEMRNTGTGVVLGTPAYMSPEQCLGARAVDHRADLYSLGIIAFQLVTGQLPYRRGNFTEMLLAHQFEPVPLASAIAPEVPPWMDSLITRALAKAPGDRFASAGELEAELRRAVKPSAKARQTGPYDGGRPSAQPRVATLRRAVDGQGEATGEGKPAEGKPAEETTTLHSASGELAAASPQPARHRLLPALVGGLGIAAAALGGTLLLGRQRGPSSPVAPPISPERTSAAAPAATSAAAVEIRLAPAPPDAAVTPSSSDTGASTSRARRANGALKRAAVAAPRTPSRPNTERADDPLRSQSPLLDGLDDFMRNRPKPSKQEFPR